METVLERISKKLSKSLCSDVSFFAFKFGLRNIIAWFPSPYLKSLHVLIPLVDHDFLERDSFANCSEIRNFSRDEVMKFLQEKPERVVGNITEPIFNEIITTLTHARTIAKRQKLQFGLL